MKRVQIDLPDETFAGLDRESAELATELRAAAAAKWYEVGRVSQEVAAQIAGVSRSEFVPCYRASRSLPCKRVWMRRSRARDFCSSRETGGAQCIASNHLGQGGLPRSAGEARFSCSHPTSCCYGNQRRTDRGPRSSISRTAELAFR